MSKDSLVKGTLILTMAALIARSLGVVQRIPLVYLLGEKGMAWYSIAFNVYSMLLVIATAGIPSALSKMIAEKTALGRHAEADRIYRAAVLFSLAAGVLMTLLLYVAAPYYADFSANPESAYAIRSLAPALLLFPLIAIMRGYFQGRQMMMPNGLSQIIEQIFRVVASVVLAYLLLAYGLEMAAAGASFGGVLGSVAAAAVMLYFIRKLRRSDAKQGVSANPKQAEEAAALGLRSIYGQLFKLSVPIVLFSVTVTLIYTIDSTIVTPLLQGQIGTEHAVEMLGILGGRAQSLAGIPIILAVALSQSVVPIISAAYSKRDLDSVAAQASKALRLSILTGLPAVLVICAAARPLDAFIFGNATGSAVVAEHSAWIIAALTASAMFQILMQTSGAILMGLGRMKPLVASVIVGIAVKLVFSFMFAPYFGIYGIIGATSLCFIVMTVLNMSMLKTTVKFSVMGRRWVGLSVTTAVVILAGWGIEQFNRSFMNLTGIERLDDMLQAILACGVVGAVYVLLLPLTKTITAADVQHLPGPARKLASRFVKQRAAASSGE